VGACLREFAFDEAPRKLGWKSLFCPRADAHRILSERPNRATAKECAAALVTRRVTRRDNARSEQGWLRGRQRGLEFINASRNALQTKKTADPVPAPPRFSNTPEIRSTSLPGRVQMISRAKTLFVAASTPASTTRGAAWDDMCPSIPDTRASHVDAGKRFIEKFTRMALAIDIVRECPYIDTKARTQFVDATWSSRDSQDTSCDRKTAAAFSRTLLLLS